jgi:hypothetical protein
MMKLPQQTKPVERKTYNANAATVGANASASLSPLIAETLFPMMNL